MEQPKTKQPTKDAMNCAASELNSFLMDIEEKYGLGFDQVQLMLNEIEQARLSGKKQIAEPKNHVPVCIFNNDSLSSLEAIVKYLRENMNLKYSEIALLLKRDAGPIGVTYRNAKKKMPARFVTTPSQLLPISILKNRRLSVLENIVSFFRDQGMRYSEIADIINRNDRTVWTVSQRAELKLKSMNKMRQE